MNAEHLNTFFRSINNVMGMMAGVTLGINGVTGVKSPLTSRGLAVTIGVTGMLRGNVLVNMSKGTFLSVAGRMIGSKVTESDELTKSAIGELFNMVLGGVASEYAGMGILVNITPPSIAEGESTFFSMPGESMICVTMSKEDILFDIYIGLRESRSF